MTGIPYPPFPEDIPTHPLLVIDYELIKKDDQKEIDRLWEAATKLGFWYLKNHGAENEVEAMFKMGAETMKLPISEKMKYEQGDDGMSFGYKAAGANAVDENGALDTVEFINISKNDALAWPKRVHRDYPSTVEARMDSTIKPFIEKSVDVNLTIMRVLGQKLGLPEGALANLHATEDPSCCETRCIRNPPAKGLPSDKQALGAHTDFGSLSFLHNKIGGLRVLPPGYEEWQYIKPIPDHAICNVGDALSIFSGGILRSNLHRVITPPKDHAKYERWSLVFFSRPANHVLLRALTEDSPCIAGAVAQSPDPTKFDPGQTAHQWFSRRVKYQRVKNRTGPESWRASRGTEHTESLPANTTVN